jgi:hypothetical protein
VIAFGASVQGAEAFRRYAEPGIALAAEPDSELHAYATVEPLARAYNLILDAVGSRPELEALVLVQPHVEITDPGFCTKLRRALADPRVALVGCAGATGVRSIAWWDGAVTAGRLVHHYNEFGGGELPAYGWTTHRLPTAEVQTIDGQLLVLSPWAVRNLRFDERLIYNHGFDLDLCLQAAAAGRRTLVADLQVTYHRSVDLIKEFEVWLQAHMQLGKKWDEVLQGRVEGEQAWKRRARRAEAEREAARAIAFSQSLKIDARMLELERELEGITRSFSWRLTAPLRAINGWRRRAIADRLRAPGESLPYPPGAATGPRRLGPEAQTAAPPAQTHWTAAAGARQPPGELDAPAHSPG